MIHTIPHRSTGAILALAGLLVATAPQARAQEPLGTPEARDRDCVCVRGPAPRPAIAFFGADRARIGVRLGDATTAAGRTGVRVEAAEEDGPAARAGIRGGDVIVAVDGTALGDEPGRRLVELLARTRPGDTVRVEYARDGRLQTADVATDRRPGFSLRGGDRMRVLRPDFEMPDVAELRRAAPVARGAMIARMLGGGLRLAELNEGLGEYFGTAEGVLVLDVDDDGLGLRAGDVILSIAGRAVRDPGHARSIIGSYRPDEEIRFQVMRNGRRTEVTGRRTDRD